MVARSREPTPLPVPPSEQLARLRTATRSVRALGLGLVPLGVAIALTSLVAGQQAAFSVEGPRVDVGVTTSDILLAFDINGDGWVDLLTEHPDLLTSSELDTDGIELHFGAPDGFTALPVPLPGSDGVIAGLADVTGDGRLDVLVLGESGTAWVHAALPGGVFAPAVASEIANAFFKTTATGDFNGDSHADLAHLTFTDDGLNVGVALGSSDGQVIASTSALFAMHAKSPGAEVVDADADGSDDLVSPLVDLGTGEDFLGVALSGDGTIHETTAVPMPGNINVGELDSADIDGDGLEDVIWYSWYEAAESAAGMVAEASDAPVGVLRFLDSQGNGTFAPAGVQAALGVVPGNFGYHFAVHAADVNTDGYLDVVVLLSRDPFVEGGPMSGELGVYLGTTDPFVFAPLEVSPAPKLARASTPVDLDADGHLDLAIIHDGAHGDVFMAMGRGDGSFAFPMPLETPDSLGSTSHVVLADLNGDSLLDALATFSGIGGPAAALSGGVAGFGPVQDLSLMLTCQQALAADLNGDGHSDIALDGGPFAGPFGGLRVALGTGAVLSYGATNLIAPVDVDVLRMADLNVDGHVDLLTATVASSAIDARLGHADGTFDEPVPYPTAGAPVDAIASDFDQDSWTDICVAPDGSDSLDLLWGAGGGVFQPAASVHVETPVAYLALGDIDGNSWLDVGLAHDQSGASLLLGFPGRAFEHGASIDSESAFLGIELADIDRDSRLDLLVLDPSAAAVRVWPSLGIGPFGISYLFDAGRDPVSFDAGDVDGDGDTDLVTAAREDGVLWIIEDIEDGFASLGKAKAVSFGAPILLVEGSPEPDQLVAFSTAGVPAPAIGLLFVGLSTGYVPFQGGTLVPSPDSALPMRPGFPLSGRWPQLPAGTPLYAQAWFAAAGEIAGTNAVVGVTQ